jgi:hypothetical protein
MMVLEGEGQAANASRCQLDDALRFANHVVMMLTLC